MRLEWQVELLALPPPSAAERRLLQQQLSAVQQEADAMEALLRQAAVFTTSGATMGVLHGQLASHVCTA